MIKQQTNLSTASLISFFAGVTLISVSALAVATLLFSQSPDSTVGQPQASIERVNR